eukprot:CAMPEP_0170481938 /NCGR_PEP_ID=MMETSP0208-20121228/2183_1 /TAXON_ID=197538 /ORGANISM="Strombidium inclinatum, Strain S3" /LENGTH=258 /DNA_ID=CAMNT_0010754725 /DNA_START=247 /DNA_END=1025 /DNA_ORIENTATION=+
MLELPNGGYLAPYERPSAGRPCCGDGSHARTPELEALCCAGLRSRLASGGQPSESVTHRGFSTVTGPPPSAGVVVLGSAELSDGSVEGLVRSSEFEVLGIGQLRKLVGSLLGFVQVVVDTLDLGVVILAFALLESDGVSQAVDLVLVLSLLLSELSKLVLEVIGVFTEAIGVIGFGADISLESNALLLPPADLVSDGANFGLVFVIRSVLLVHQEAQVFNLLAEGVSCNHILVVSVVVVVVLHELFILEMSVLLLDSV